MNASKENVFKLFNKKNYCGIFIGKKIKLQLEYVFNLAIYNQFINLNEWTKTSNMKYVTFVLESKKRQVLLQTHWSFKGQSVIIQMGFQVTSDPDMFHVSV